ncbi:MAG TPA: EF-hand domain-containing protein [Candidatus Nitrosotenuis sp.]|jgi:Ca2+-binding EF-hand superfamily protein|nr:EF-hand domain-containing protein [Candidatus Nitrosotenuis sp.]
MLTPLQRRKLSRKFALLDTDHDGRLRQGDLQRVQAYLASMRSLDAGSPEGTRLVELFSSYWKALERSCDRDWDGTVTLEEWLHYHDLALWREAEALATSSHYHGTLEGAAGFLFELLDADGDGRITRQEYRQFLSACGLDAHEAAECFMRLDLDGDGYLSRDEMLTLVDEFYFSQNEDAPGNWLFGAHEGGRPAEV